MTDHAGLPVEGYREQSRRNVLLVNEHKVTEERLLRRIEGLCNDPYIDVRWLNIAKTHIEQGFMALNRAVFRPGRVKLPEDTPSNGWTFGTRVRHPEHGDGRVVGADFPSDTLWVRWDKREYDPPEAAPVSSVERL